jgi:thymidylate synthase (FAD)
MIDVEYIDHVGNDETVVNAARVSFNKEAHLYTDEQNTKLIRYLAKHKHFSPFNHCFVTFRVKAPIFVARQLVKHEYMPWNEVSRRYVDDDPEFFEPGSWRKRADNVKQGSGDAIPLSLQERLDDQLNGFYELALNFYRDLLAEGVCPEQARMILPQSMMTEWFWSGSLKAFAKMCKLRLDSHAQVESRQVAELINGHMRAIYPVSWDALKGAEL